MILGVGVLKTGVLEFTDVNESLQQINLMLCKVLQCCILQSAGRIDATDDSLLTSRVVVKAFLKLLETREFFFSVSL